ncbi:MAG: histidine kinase, partial [Candidatus Omnitrophica bacterium]|nr:histidine kinase [Candidatus Omnitrophota bacterium]
SNDLIIQADHNQLKQVFLNLFLNAIDAMPQGGTLSVKSVMNTNQQLEITVADTGVGIAKKDLAHIFDPFFSKKETGTGLGLAICFGIIKEHKGLIKVESVVGKGTMFRIVLLESRKES